MTKIDKSQLSPSAQRLFDELAYLQTTDPDHKTRKIKEKIVSLLRSETVFRFVAKELKIPLVARGIVSLTPQEEARISFDYNRHAINRITHPLFFEQQQRARLESDCQKALVLLTDCEARGWFKKFIVDAEQKREILKAKKLKVKAFYQVKSRTWKSAHTVRKFRTRADERQ